MEHAAIPDKGRDLKLLLTRPLAVAMFGLCIWLAWRYPVGETALASGLALYFVVLLRWPALWLIVLPMTLPVLELAFWSGRYFFNEYDLLVLTTIASGLWHGGAWTRQIDRGSATVAILLLLGQLAITANGLFPLVTPVPGAWQDYFASTNALREFKGILWALLLWPMLGAARARGDDLQRWLAIGMAAGLSTAFLSVVWERGLFTGLFNFSHPYRVSGWFFSMHTGGAAIDAFLAMSAPFIISLMLMWRRLEFRIAALALASAALYAFFVTYSRANYPALLAMFAVVTWGIFANFEQHQPHRKSGGRRKIIFAGLSLLIVTLLAATAIILGPQIQNRFLTTKQDLATRFEHWNNATDAATSYPLATYLGRGKGAFPRDYYWHHQANGQHLALAQLYSEESKNFVRFSKSDGVGNLFLQQRFDRVASDDYLLKVMLRTPRGKPEALLIEFCERHILKFRAECRWTKIKVPASNGGWQELTAKADLRGLGQPKFGPFIRPLDISLMNRGINTGLDIGSVKLLAPDGTNLLLNSDFSADWDHWFLTYGDHLRWHIKNVFVYWYYEGGVAGLVLMLALGLYAGHRLVNATRSGDFFALTTLAALGGAIMVGLFDSLFDDPRISMLFFLLTGAGLISRPQNPLPLPSMPSWLTKQRIALLGRVALYGLVLMAVLRLLMPPMFRPWETRLAMWAEQRGSALSNWLAVDHSARTDQELAIVRPAWSPLDALDVRAADIRIGDRKFKTLAEAARALQAGDHLMIGAGVYHEPLVIEANNVLVSGFGHVVIERAQAQGKAAIITRGNNIRISNIECREIAVSDQNGACVRHEGYDLTLHHVYFHSSEQGLLTGPRPGRVHIVDSRFEKLGKLGQAHGVYMGLDGELIIEDSELFAAKSWGHEIKSRAKVTRVVRSTVASLGSNDSRLLDIPHGGLLVIEDSILQQGPASAEEAAIGFGLEGKLHPQQRIEMRRNIVILERDGNNELFRFADSTPEETISANVFINAGQGGGDPENVYFDSREETDIGPYPNLPKAPRG
ncbi:MAG: hypothetical protein R3E46_14200 [Sedimenticolaceae bacterium]